MRNDIQHDIVRRLINDYEMKERGEWLQQGVCPSCNKKELFTRLDQPWIVRCGRENKCGWEGHTKQLYPDAFANFNQRFVASQQNPNATADAYLKHARGLDISRIKGWYRQGKFWHPKGNKSTATVRFDIDRAHDIYMERLVEEVTITDDSGESSTRKAHFNGSHKGLWWQPPGMQINRGDTIWLVEGCLDAIALHLNGQKAVATLSCHNYPQKPLEQYKALNITWVWALDNDPAGQRYLKQWMHRSCIEGLDVSAAQIPQQGRHKIDWHECHTNHKLSEKHREEYLYHGSLLIAKSALDKALLIWNRKNLNGFCVDFNHCMYWFKLDINKYNKITQSIRDANNGETEQQIRINAAAQSGALSEIANCHPQFLYFQSNKVTDESWYYCRVDFPHNGQSIKNTFTGGQVSSATEFKKRLLSIAPGGLFTGTSKQLDWLVKNHIHNIKVVDTVDFIGYSKEHTAYVFNDLAMRDGKAYDLNDEDFFEIDRLSIKSLNQGVQLHIGAQSDYRADWPQLVYQGFGVKGLVAVSFWLGALFAEQIRGIHKSFPFLEIVGEPGAGKTTLVEFMWKLLGKRDEEGWDPSKATAATLSRKFLQVSNLPVVLIEADREEGSAKARKFDWDELKTAYNGRAIRARGMKNSGNETYEPPFRGAVVITQNAEVCASEAILQRIVHLYFDKSNHSPQSKAATDQMNLIGVNNLSFFLRHAILNEAQIMSVIAKMTPVYEKHLLSLPEIKSVRIALNHAQIMALADGLNALVNLHPEQHKAVHACIRQLAIERQQAIGADHPVVQQFWEIYEYLNGNDQTPVLNHSHNNQLIAVNLNHFVRVAVENKQQVPLLTDLKKYLKTAISRKFQAIKAINSAIETKTVKCWLFIKEPSQ